MTIVKICGITNPKDAVTAANAGADLMGFVFFPRSPRYVSPEKVRRIVAQLRAESFNPSLRFVGVFVDDSQEAVAQTLDFCGLDFAQLHGTEPPEIVNNLMTQGWAVIKAFRVRDKTALLDLEGFRATAYLLDAYVPGKPGGTGHSFDWKLAGEAKAHGRILLAGGLTPENVALAVRTAQPWGVDVSSGVEESPGRKSPDKVKRFVTEAKNAPEPRNPA
jgi:phosphoribosylanthranilate isomerase